MARRRRDAFLDAETRELGVKMEMSSATMRGVPPGIACGGVSPGIPVEECRQESIWSPERLPSQNRKGREMSSQVWSQETLNLGSSVT